ncbi:MAG: hypothetical protein IKW18_05305 [Clostridia bacterium]|nr:hypothetical protein [Clostridia bacterium]
MEKKSFRLGKNAQKVLLFSLPLLVFFAFALTLYVGLSDAATLIREREMIFALLETLSRFLVCLALGMIFADYAEKKSA